MRSLSFMALYIGSETGLCDLLNDVQRVVSGSMGEEYSLSRSLADRDKFLLWTRVELNEGFLLGFSSNLTESL